MVASLFTNPSEVQVFWVPETQEQIDEIVEPDNRTAPSSIDAIRHILTETVESAYDDAQQVVRLEGLDLAIIGNTFLGPDRKIHLVYSVARVTRVLMLRDKLNSEQAIDFLEFNILPVGSIPNPGNVPVFVH